jgi:tetratricopeptide (TPR) repeat protein
MGGRTAREATMTALTHRSRASRIAAAALAAMLGLAATAEAQTATRNNATDNGGVVAANVVRAEALEAQAAGRLNQMTGYARTARLYEQAAMLRPEQDPTRIEDLHMAGHIYFRAGRHEAARRNLASAAETALQFGDLVRAAHAFIDAAHVASQQRDMEAAAGYAKRAGCLSNSPLISVAEAAAIRRRLGANTGAVYVVR